MGVRAEQTATLRRELLASAAEHFERSGFTRARLTDIAAGAGVTTGAFYRYFPTKLDVFYVLFEQYADAVTAAVVDCRSLEDLCQAWLEVHASHVGCLRAAEEIANNDADLRARHAGFRQVWAAAAFSHLDAEPDTGVRRILSYVAIDVLDYLVFTRWHGWSTVEPESVAFSLARVLREGFFPESLRDAGRGGQSPADQQTVTRPEPPPVRWTVAKGRIEPTSARGRAQRDAVVRSAMAVFAAQGYEHSSIGDIAAHAGVSAATVYRYFQDKRDVFGFLLADAEQALWARGTFMIDEDGRVRVGEAVRRFMEARERDAAVYVVWRELLGSDAEVEQMWVRLRSDFHEGLARVIGRCQRLGTVPSEHDPAVAAELIVAMFDGTAHSRFDLGWTYGLATADLAAAMTSRMGPD